jgi:beta-glucanase (GH16 family)
MLDLTGYKLTFDEEFNTRSISQTGENTTWSDIRPEWRFDANSDIGFGRSSFVDAASGYDPFRVEGGALSITAVPDRTQWGYKGSWESGLIHTKGEFSQTYGYFEMRADMNSAPGGWDAFWLLPDQPAPNPDGRPGWQELDIVEHYGEYDIGTYRWIHSTDPTQNPNAERQVFSDNPEQSQGFHTYGMNWQKDTIEFYFDGRFMGSQPTPSDMHGPMYLLANLATQDLADKAGVPLTMAIDYIRVFSNAPDAKAVPLGPVSAPDGQDPGLYGATAAVFAAPKLNTPKVKGGTKGNDVLHGTKGSDAIDAKSGDDVVFAGAGNDIIVGSSGKDRLYGQSGDDTFVFASTSHSRVGSKRDVIIDFKVAHDKIDLHLMDANTKLAGDQAFTWSKSKHFSGAAGELHALSGGGVTILEGDVNGDRRPDFQLQLNKVVLSVSDLFL